MGSSTVGASTTAAVDTSKPPRFAYANRYSWSTAGGATARGSLVYRPTDNCLYKLDNTNSALGELAKWNLTTSTSTSLSTSLYNTVNPITAPVLVIGSDTNIYCMPHGDNESTYNMPIAKYVVSTNTWSNPSMPGHFYTFNLVNAPEKQSFFSNSSDVVFVGGHYGSGGQLYLNNLNTLTNIAVAAGDGSAPAQTGISQGILVEIKNGDDSIYPTGYVNMNHPRGGANSTIGIASANWGIANPRTASALHIYFKTVSNWNTIATYNNRKFINGNASGTQSRSTCLESRWIVSTPYGSAEVLDIKTGDLMPARGLHYSTHNTGGGTNVVYISATKKLYYHATDNYLYEYNVTFE